jgi:antirestriction protein ArdC
MNKAYEIITETIIEKLEQGTVPWHQPWSSEAAKNLISKREYRGINVFLLGASRYANPYWLTFRQAKQLGGHVAKGERSTPVVFWKWLEHERENAEGEAETYNTPLLRYYRLFNVEQCEGIPADKVPALENAREFQPIEEAERVVRSMPQRPIIQHVSAQAFYRPSADVVNMPAPELFTSDAEYYSTLFHELTHATGHESRLKRLDTDKLAAHCGIAERIIDNSAAYIQGWLRRLRNDKRLVVFAAAQANKAADFILDNERRK